MVLIEIRNSIRILALAFVSAFLLGCETFRQATFSAADGIVRTESSAEVPAKSTFALNGREPKNETEIKIRKQIISSFRQLGFTQAEYPNDADVQVVYFYFFSVNKDQMDRERFYATGGSSTYSSEAAKKYPSYFSIAVIPPKSTRFEDTPEIYWFGEYITNRESAYFDELSAYSLNQLLPRFGTTGEARFGFLPQGANKAVRKSSQDRTEAEATAE